MKCTGEDFFGRGENLYRTTIIAGGFEVLEVLKAVVSRRWYDMILEKTEHQNMNLIFRNLRDLLQDE